MITLLVQNMTENQMGSGRPRKNSRRTNGSNNR